MKVKLNFNWHSATAWGTLLTAIATGGIGILTSLGVVVKQTDATTIYGAITAIVSLFTTLGILTVSTDKQGGNNAQK
ncbi:MAG: hypothetical protein LKG79_07590 [Furfurilactobacillus sp.]|jgi:uncharacterized membrane protein|uniref:hypothetical protein n=1 Tax=Furfurilactobacillus sp. TaxID=2767911 RepID=UPI002584C67D|nr:hypothetical protein [Furfurilactobacillus sp.]MCH4010609.1 hypothetical protein [Furfurilactobacillus sp.]MCH4036501.1 hypothetical protein [Furfurilactobacillus sp.]MCH4114553.1 hypothetical protein [Furfurilactobacillus sp.]MCH4133828.1 hypothetical protein [Furfurilactobacillus sp.]MCI1340135.1 hypothetical protein [Furfurilactobacillus sp.]